MGGHHMRRTAAAAAVEPAGPSFRFWRFAFEGGHNDRIASNEMIVSEDGGVTRLPAVLTSNTSDSPTVVSANSEDGTSGVIWKPFGESGGSWRSDAADAVSTVYWQIDFGAGNTRSLNYWKAQWFNASSYGPPTGFDVLGSDTGAFSGEQTLVHNETGLANVAAGVYEYTW